MVDSSSKVILVLLILPLFFENVQLQKVQCGVRKINKIKQIVNGHGTIPGQWPWHAAIYHSKKFTDTYACGGTLLSTQFVLTAAHCVIAENGHQISKNYMFVRLGVHNLHELNSGTLQQHSIGQIHEHADYSSDSVQNDIALLELATVVKFNNYVQPACLGLMQDLTGHFGTVVGWGITETDEISPTLKSVRMPVIDFNKCLESDRAVFGESLSEGILCAGYTNGITVCNGDSGGGLFFQRNDSWYLGGIVSYTEQRSLEIQLCNTNGYGAFTNVRTYLPWIRQITQLHLKDCAIFSQGNNSIQDDHPFRGTRAVGFDWNLTKRVLGAAKSNAVMSPFSVKLLLVLLYEASGNNADTTPTQTKKELRTVLEPNGTLLATRTLYRQWLDSALSQNKAYDLEMGTKLFVEEYIEIQTKYQIISDYYYNTTVDKVPFSKPKEAARIINNWINSTTRGHISKLVTADGIKGAIVILINAIYFKGLWTYSFPENGSRLPFHTHQKQVQAEFMQQNGHFYYDDSTTLNAQLLRMSYRGDKIAMYIILPHEGRSVEYVLQRITPASLHQALGFMNKTNVDITIPKLRFEYEEPLLQRLHDSGIREIFLQNTSLPLIGRRRGTQTKVQVSQVFHKTGIAIDEQGSEAYFATDANIMNKFGDGCSQVFNVNRPFLFFIEDENSGSLLFAGRVEDPTI